MLRGYACLSLGQAYKAAKISTSLYPQYKMRTVMAIIEQQLTDTLISKSFAGADYVCTLTAMVNRIQERIAIKKLQELRTPDELWIVDHNDVYTLGQASKEEHILQRTNTPIIKTDRGGQVTWHGHGQLVIYYLFDLESLGWGVRHLVSHAEQAIEDVINDCLNDYTINDSDNQSSQSSQAFTAKARRDAPGVYLYSKMADDSIMLGKMASLGFKIKHGFSYHGIALNIDCDLSAFNAINPCGYAGMQMLRLADFVTMDSLSDSVKNSVSYQKITQKLIDNIAKRHAGQIELRSIAPKLS